jgi:hypothetical protein
MLYKEKPLLDIRKIKEEFADPDSYTNRTYSLYRETHKGKKGNKFDKESFFLDYLALEIRRSKVERSYFFAEEYDFHPTLMKLILKGKHTEIISSADIRDYLKVSKAAIYREVSNFIKVHLPNTGINHDPKRIKLKIWRLRKSGVLDESRERQQAVLPQKRGKGRRPRGAGKLAQDVTCFVAARPNKIATQREVLRKFSSVRKEELDSIKGILEEVYGIEILVRKGYRNKQAFYRFKKNGLTSTRIDNNKITVL